MARAGEEAIERDDFQVVVAIVASVWVPTTLIYPSVLPAKQSLFYQFGGYNVAAPLP
ncbi:MAG: hypothetical protein ACSLEL_00340 [Candidatus Malihini olakiniferum]